MAAGRRGRDTCLLLVTCKWHGMALYAVIPPNEPFWEKSIGVAARCIISCACKPIFGYIGRPTRIILISSYPCKDQAALPYQLALLRTRSPCHNRKSSSALWTHLLHRDFCNHISIYFWSVPTSLSLLIQKLYQTYRDLGKCSNSNNKSKLNH